MRVAMTGAQPQFISSIEQREDREFEPCSVSGVAPRALTLGAWRCSRGRRRRTAVVVNAADELEQAVVVLAAGGAAGQVRPHARHGAVGVAAGEREVDVAVELLEALLAGQLGPAGPSSAAISRGARRCGRRSSVVPPVRRAARSKPSAASAARSFGARRAASCRARRASC